MFTCPTWGLLLTTGVPMSFSPFGRLRLRYAALVVFALFAGVFTMVPSAAADSAPSDPTDPATPQTVSADALPTVQIDGVAWDQVIVGNTVYVAGKFGNARPAGAAPGTQQTQRRNLLAYNLTTGALITSFAPDLNAQALVVTASPDGSRIYVGGDFTTANGQTRNRVAAYDTATGALVGSFRPSVYGQVRAIAATNSTIYVGGNFTSIGGGLARKNLAAFTAADGVAQPWAPVTGSGRNLDGAVAKTSAVQALVVNGAGSRVIVAGRFGYLNDAVASGVGALDPVTGETRPFAINQLLTNQGDDSAILSLSLSPDGASVFGTAYDFYGPGNFEGTFKADSTSGTSQWVEDCHGDHYQAYSTGSVTYTSSHAYVCSNIGGFPEQNPRLNYFAQAFSDAATGTVGDATLENGNLRGQPAPSELEWSPTFTAGTVTGQSQATWAVTGNGQYVVYGGEFRTVNGTSQTGLVRFADPSIAPNRVGPFSPAELTPTVVSLSSGTARVSWQATYDRDNENLRYRVFRDGDLTAPVYETTAASRWWNRPQLGFVDRGLVPGQTYSYRVIAYDPYGNLATRDSTSVTVSDSGSAGGAYSDAVLASGAQNYWRLGEDSGTAYDFAGFSDLAVNGSVARGSAGAIVGDPDTAYDFSGSDGSFAATQTPIPGPQTFSVEAWFKTTTTTGGKIVGFGSNNTGNSGSYDRHVFMDNSGIVYFGVYPGQERRVQSSQPLNDGNWHQVVATLGPGGMALYIDGLLVGSRADTTSAQPYDGYWRIGGDSTWAGGPYFDGAIDDVAIYPGVLDSQQVSQQYDIGVAAPPNVGPTASFTSGSRALNAVFDATASTDSDGQVASYDWTFGDGSTGSGATTSHRYAEAGTYPVTLTVTDNDGASASSTVDVIVTGAANSPYANAVLDSGATSYWRLAESSGQFFDTAAFSDLNVGSGVSRGQTGALASDPNAAAGFDGTDSGLAATQTAIPGPNVFSAELWFNTTTTSGGKIFGFGNNNSGMSSNYDRHIYLDPAGYLYFGVYTGELRTVRSVNPVNDGAWHQVVATLGPEGLSLYVDGVLAETRADTTFGQSYDGYWRIGGDTSWSGAPFFDGLVDEVAVYPTSLPAQVASEHYALGRQVANVAPAAQLSLQANGLQLSADGSGSADTDGTIADYSWDFGDGTAPVSGATVSHDYAAGGTYPVTLTVTDDDGATNVATQTVTVTAPNAAPTAAFDSVATDLSVAFDGSGSSDADGTIAGYSWDFGDSTAPASGVSPTHTYAVAGTYSVTLTVTDDDGAQGVITTQVSVNAPPPPNEAPNAVFTSTATDLSVAFNAGDSTDSDGTIVGYTWNFGDSTALGSGVTTTHAYAAAGTYPVTLTVTDDDGTTATVTDNVTVTAPPPPANVAPTSSFTSAINNLELAVNGSGSTDSDGTIVGYAWTFGDGGTGAGATTSHTYAVAGTYPVTLTVTDDDGATAVSTTSVTATAPPPPTTATAQDGFGRIVSNGLGSADIGGPWTVAGSASAYSVNNSRGTLATPAGTTRSAFLNQASATSTTTLVAVSLDRAPTGGGAYVSLAGRHVGSTDYRARLRFLSTGSVQIQLSRVVSGTETVLQDVTVPGLSYVAGGTVQIRFDIEGTSPTMLRARAWLSGAAEPSAWQVTATDSTPALQTAGSVGLVSYGSGSATSAMAVSFDSLYVGPVGSSPGGGTNPPPNVAPNAMFTSSATGLTVSLNGGTSSDSDGTIASYAWTFGDGTDGSGVTTSHAYTSGGTYAVTLTVTDDDGATSTVSGSVVVTGPAGPPAALAADAFGRTVSAGLGAADTGGPYTTYGPASSYAVDGSGGTLSAPAGQTRQATLNAVSAQDVAVQVSVSMNRLSSSTGNYVWVLGRQVVTDDYRVRLRVLSTGVVNATLFRMSGGVLTSLRSADIAGLSYAAGQVLNLRLDLSGVNATTIRAKVWAAGSAEPTGWQLTATDSAASLQASGGVGMGSYVSGSETNGPIVSRFDNFWVGASGTAPA